MRNEISYNKIILIMEIKICMIHASLFQGSPVFLKVNIDGTMHYQYQDGRQILTSKVFFLGMFEKEYSLHQY